MDTCIVSGCESTTDDGKFVGDICSSCHDTLVTGESTGKQTFIDKLRMERDHFELLVIDYEHTELYGSLE